MMAAPLPKPDGPPGLPLLSACGLPPGRVEEVVQKLWSGYGSILRVALDDCRSVIVKHIRPPSSGKHPRGWNTDRSHRRKLRSYEVETLWYRDWSTRCDDRCRIPRFIAAREDDGETLLVLEDLDAAGFSGRHRHVDDSRMDACLSWLAHFHATFLGESPDGLWETGTYWHLETRSDELAALDDLPLKQAAGAIDGKLKAARFQTIVHGDAKLANFCFSPDGSKVAAVDFQYVGGGCGMKDLAYFIGSCLDEDACEAREAVLLDSYFGHFRKSLADKRPEVDAVAVEIEWRSLFHLAWTDFHRFLKGWSPGHWKINSYSERLAREVVVKLSTC